jgi:hypothetical protein
MKKPEINVMGCLDATAATRRCTRKQPRYRYFNDQRKRTREIRMFPHNLNNGTRHRLLC